MPIDADVKGGYGSLGNRPNDPRGQTRGGDGLQRSVQNRFQFNPVFSPPTTTPPRTSLAIPNLGISFSNPNIGQGITSLGTVNTGSGFNFDRDGADRQGGLNQDFTPQVGPPPTSNIPAAPRQGIDTLPVINEITSASLQTPTFTNFIKGLPFDPDNLFGGFPPGEDDTSSFESGETVIDNLISVFEAMKEPQFNLGVGTLSTDLEKAAQSLFDDDPTFGLKYTVPLN